MHIHVIQLCKDMYMYIVHVHVYMHDCIVSAMQAIDLVIVSGFVVFGVGP